MTFSCVPANLGEWYAMSVCALIVLLLIAACVATALDSRRPSGRFISEEAFARIEQQGRS